MNNIDKAVKVAIVYHSGYGHTEKQAEAVSEGVMSITGVEVQLFKVEEGVEPPWQALEHADAIIFGTPTYMGGPSAQFKGFQDATSNKVFAAGSKWKDKVAAGFTNAASRSGDKLATLIQLMIFAAQHGMHWVNLGLPPANNSTVGSESELNRHGFFLGAAAQSNADEGPEVAPPKADLDTARHLGARVAKFTQQLARGDI